MQLQGKTVFITGASRGIGEAIALKAAEEGANVVITAKTVEPHPKLPDTIHSVKEACEAKGAQAIAVQMDVRYEEQVEAAVAQAVEAFGGIDILINNAGAISITAMEDTPMKRFDLMMGINLRGSYLCAQKCLPYLKKSDNAHIVMLSPPIDMDPVWFAKSTPYTISKFSMSMLAFGLAAELHADGIAVNAVWPKTTIRTAAVLNVLGGEAMGEKSRKPSIMADAICHLVSQDATSCSGQFLSDEDLMAQAGVQDLTDYQVNPALPPEGLMPDLFVKEYKTMLMKHLKG